MDEENKVKVKIGDETYTEDDFVEKEEEPTLEEIEDRQTLYYEVNGDTLTIEGFGTFKLRKMNTRDLEKLQNESIGIDNLSGNNKYLPGTMKKWQIILGIKSNPAVFSKDYTDSFADDRLFRQLCEKRMEEFYKWDAPENVKMIVSQEIALYNNIDQNKFKILKKNSKAL